VCFACRIDIGLFLFGQNGVCDFVVLVCSSCLVCDVQEGRTAAEMAKLSGAEQLCSLLFEAVAALMVPGR
jgi:hypothetical protein